MKANNRTELKMRFHVPPALVLGVAVLWLTGCHTAGYKKSDAAALNSQAAATNVQAESQQLATTLAALNDLVNQPSADAKPQFLLYRAALDRLDKSAKQATSSLNHVWHKRDAYFQVWDKEIADIQNEEIRQRSQVRRAEVSNQFDSARKQCDEAQSGLMPLIGYLHDLRKALSADLTRNGLMAVQPSLISANERARQVQDDLTRATAELDALSARTSSSRVQDVK